MLQRAALVEAIGHRERLAVIGNRNVFQPGLFRRSGHGRHGVFPVGLGRVDVQIAAQVGAIDEPGQPPGMGRFDFAASFAQLRRNPRENERRVNASSSAPATRSLLDVNSRIRSM